MPPDEILEEEIYKEACCNIMREAGANSIIPDMISTYISLDLFNLVFDHGGFRYILKLSKRQMIEIFSTNHTEGIECHQITTKH